MALEAGFGNSSIIDWLMQGFTEGYKIGVAPEARVPFEAKNTASAVMAGEKTSGAIASWGQSG